MPDAAYRCHRNGRPSDSSEICRFEPIRGLFFGGQGVARKPILHITRDVSQPELPYLVGAAKLMDGQLRRAGGNLPDSEFLNPVTKRVGMKV